MKSTTWVRWTLATAVFLAIGWAMRHYGLNTARLLLLLLLLLVYVYGGHGRQTSGAGDARTGTRGDGAGDASDPAGADEPTGQHEPTGAPPPDDQRPDGS